MRSSVIVYHGHAFYFVVSMEQTGQKRALRVISKAIKRQIAFYLTQTNEMNTLLEMSFITGMSVPRNLSKTHFSIM